MELMFHFFMPYMAIISSMILISLNLSPKIRLSDEYLRYERNINEHFLHNTFSLLRKPVNDVRSERESQELPV